MAPSDSEHYTPRQLLPRLLELGKAQDFEAVQRLSRDVRLLDYPRYGEVLEFSVELSSADLADLIKAIGKFEDVRGGGGSPSMNYVLQPPDHSRQSACHASTIMAIASVSSSQ